MYVHPACPQTKLRYLHARHSVACPHPAKLGVQQKAGPSRGVRDVSHACMCLHKKERAQKGARDKTERSVRPATPEPHHVSSLPARPKESPSDQKRGRDEREGKREGNAHVVSEIMRDIPDPLHLPRPDLGPKARRRRRKSVLRVDGRSGFVDRGEDDGVGGRGRGRRRGQSGGGVDVFLGLRQPIKARQRKAPVRVTRAPKLISPGWGEWDVRGLAFGRREQEVRQVRLRDR